MPTPFRATGVNGECSDLNGPHVRMRDGAEAFGLVVQDPGPQYRQGGLSPDTAGHMGFGDRSGANATCAIYLSARPRRCRRKGDRRLLSQAGAGGERPRRRRGGHPPIPRRVPRGVDHQGSARGRRGRLTGIAALLLRSGIGGPAVGKYLHPHPVVAFVAIYPEETNPWWGALMTAMVDSSPTSKTVRFPDPERAMVTVGHRLRHSPVLRR